MVGYFALLDREDGTMILTHLYLRSDRRGEGLGRRVMEFVRREAVSTRAPAIGPGVELEDYVMRKAVDGH
jgi:predicted GNAT family acetyltransferase